MNVLTINLVSSTVVFWVPALLVTHYITFVVLAKHWPRVGDSRTGPR
jgi:hypothetical protein